MLLRIPALLTPEEVATCRQTLEQAPWEDGRATAGQLAAQVKHNLQLPLASEAAKTLGEFLLNKLAHNPLYLSAALPHQPCDAFAADVNTEPEPQLGQHARRPISRARVGVDATDCCRQLRVRDGAGRR